LFYVKSVYGHAHLPVDRRLRSTTIREFETGSILHLWHCQSDGFFGGQIDEVWLFKREFQFKLTK